MAGQARLAGSPDCPRRGPARPIRDAQRAVSFYEGDDRRRAHALLAETYNLAQFFLAYQPAADLLWRVAERAMATAREADEPYAIGAPVWLLARLNCAETPMP